MPCMSVLARSCAFGQSNCHVLPAPIRTPERSSRLDGQMQFLLAQLLVTPLDNIHRFCPIHPPRLPNPFLAIVTYRFGGIGWGGGCSPNKPIRCVLNFGFARPHQQAACDHLSWDSNPGFVAKHGQGRKMAKNPRFGMPWRGSGRTLALPGLEGPG